MKYKAILFGLFCSTLMVSPAFTQKLSFKIAGVPDTTIHLVKYVGSKLYYADTAEIVSGNVQFDGSKQEPGILAVLLPEQKYFEFIYNNEEVQIETKAPDFIPNMKVKKSNENKVFYEYIHYLQEQQADSKVLQEQKNQLDSEADAGKIEGIDAQLKEINERVTSFQKSVVAENEGTLVSKILKMSIDIDIPEPSNPEDSTFKYRYFRDHYFDHVDFSDDRLVNAPVLQKKLEYYLSPQMMIQHPDTMIKYVSKVVDPIEPGTMMYRFFITKTTGHFEKSKIMGMDKAFNVFVDRYYCGNDPEGKRKANWMDEEKLNELCESTKTRLRLVQGEIPPNLILTDSTSQKWYNMYELESEYVILYFWDPGCGHCKKETPKLQKLYAEKLKDRNVEVFAVGKATGDDFEAWKKFIKDKGLTFINVGVTRDIYNQAREDARSLVPSKTTLASLNYQETYDIYSTPRVWILDKDKRIIGKSLGVAQIESFLDRVQGFEDAPKIFEEEVSNEEQQH